MRNHNPRVVLALTATATEEIEKDIREVLGIQDAYKIVHMPERTNLKLSSATHPGMTDLIKIMDAAEGSGIVYCSTVKNVEALGSEIGTALPGRVGIFHGRMRPNDKHLSQEMFMQDQVQWMIATNAFGMGIDKPNIRHVIHHDMPGSLMSLVQENGRAGRDGKESRCLTLYQEESYKTQLYFAKQAFPEERQIRAVFELLKRSPKNADGEVEKSIEQLAYDFGNPYEKGMIANALGILVRDRVIARPKSEDKVAKVSFISTPDDQRFHKTYDAITKIARPDDDGFYAFDLELLSQRVGVTTATISKNLKGWHADGNLRYIAPFRGAPTKIIGSIDNVDFARLAIKRADLMKKLELVKKYFSIPDSEKHVFLAQNFIS